MKTIAIILFGWLAWSTIATADPCNTIYEGGYTRQAGPLTIELIPADLEDENAVDVTVSFNGRTYLGRGTCNGRSIRFDLDFAYPHAGRFDGEEKGAYHLFGTMYVNGQPYDSYEAFEVPM
jgi:hypothetical protein